MRDLNKEELRKEFLTWIKVQKNGTNYADFAFEKLTSQRSELEKEINNWKTKFSNRTHDFINAVELTEKAELKLKNQRSELLKEFRGKIENKRDAMANALESKSLEMGTFTRGSYRAAIHELNYVLSLLEQYKK